MKYNARDARSALLQTKAREGWEQSDGKRKHRLVVGAFYVHRNGGLRRLVGIRKGGNDVTWADKYWSWNCCLRVTFIRSITGPA
jgi:hypothetical protein